MWKEQGTRYRTALIKIFFLHIMVLTLPGYIIYVQDLHPLHTFDCSWRPIVRQQVTTIYDCSEKTIPGICSSVTVDPRLLWNCIPGIRLTKHQGLFWRWAAKDCPPQVMARFILALTLVCNANVRMPISPIFVHSLSQTSRLRTVEYLRCFFFNNLLVPSFCV